MLSGRILFSQVICLTLATNMVSGTDQPFSNATNKTKIAKVTQSKCSTSFVAMLIPKAKKTRMVSESRVGLKTSLIYT